MNISTFYEYLGAIKILKARELLEAITASSYPHMKADSQRKKHKELHKEAFPDVWGTKKPMSLSDVFKVIKNGR